MKKLNQLLNFYEVAKMPEDMRKKKNSILVLTIVSTSIFDILIFSIKGAERALLAGWKRVAIVLMILHFLNQVLKNTVYTINDRMKDKYSENKDAYITTSISYIANIVRGKVFREQNNFSLIMTNPEVIFNLKEYIEYIWSFQLNYPILISNIIITAIMLIVTLLTEWFETENTKTTMFFAVIVILCIVLFVILYKMRLNVRNKFREEHRKFRKENEILSNDLKNIEPLIKKEFTYRVNLLVANLKNIRGLELKEGLKLNLLHLLRVSVLAIFMIAIIIVKVSSVGGVANFNNQILAEIIAISIVYSNILDKVAFILDGLEIIANTIQDIERVKPDVDNIMKVYDQEKKINFSTNIEISEIRVEKFEFSYPGERTLYTIRNIIPFILTSGKAYLVYGHTGCGKTTLMHLLTGTIKMHDAPISYGDGNYLVYLSSIMHESNGRLGSNVVLQELIFNREVKELDYERMVDILHGTHIYEDIMCNMGLKANDDEKVLNYLNETTIEQYSSGQKQRLSIVKVLYNLDKSHEIVVFDEATNALDDSTAISVLKYMVDFCQKDKKRILLFVSHQVDLTKEITDGNITFLSEQFPIYDIKAEVN